MDSKDWTSIVVVMVIVAVVVGFVSSSLTGNIIKVQKVTTGTDIYTKTEIDSKLNNIKAKSITLLGGINGYSVDAAQGITSGYLKIGLLEGASLYADGSQVEIAKPITYTTLSGIGKAAACLDSNGRLYRGPC